MLELVLKHPAKVHMPISSMTTPGCQNPNMLGPRGQAFAVSQTRLGGGRIHHAMRSMGQIKVAFDMMCKRALSRTTKGEPLANKQMVQEKIADSWIEMEAVQATGTSHCLAY